MFTAAAIQANAVPPISEINSRRFNDRIAFGLPPARKTEFQDIELAKISHRACEPFSQPGADGEKRMPDNRNL